MRILFMGTPTFAVASLKRLLDDGHEICGVFTQPDKPKNRGMKLTFSPVKEHAFTQKLPVFQPLKMKDGTALKLVQELHPELIVVAAYGKILPQEILDAPRYGSINVHSSLLPKYRGAAPINWAILNGESETGVSIMYMAPCTVDSGDVIRVARTTILPEENAQELTERLAELGAQALSETIPTLVDGTTVRTVQDESQQTYAPMLSRELSPVNWSHDSQTIHNQVRGLIPWPCATAVLDGRTFKLFRTQIGSKTAAAPGTILSAGNDGIEIACGDGNSLRILELQAEGSRRMAATDYLRGHPIQIGNE